MIIVLVDVIEEYSGGRYDNPVYVGRQPKGILWLTKPTQNMVSHPLSCTGNPIVAILETNPVTGLNVWMEPSIAKLSEQPMWLSIANPRANPAHGNSG